MVACGIANLCNTCNKFASYFVFGFVIFDNLGAVALFERDKRLKGAHELVWDALYLRDERNMNGAGFRWDNGTTFTGTVNSFAAESYCGFALSPVCPAWDKYCVTEC